MRSDGFRTGLAATGFGNGNEFDVGVKADAFGLKTGIRSRFSSFDELILRLSLRLWCGVK
jgi:hypothetical protein